MAEIKFEKLERTKQVKAQELASEEMKKFLKETMQNVIKEFDLRAYKATFGKDGDIPYEIACKTCVDNSTLTENKIFNLHCGICCNTKILPISLTDL